MSKDKIETLNVPHDMPISIVKKNDGWMVMTTFSSPATKKCYMAESYQATLYAAVKELINEVNYKMNNESVVHLPPGRIQ